MRRSGARGSASQALGRSAMASEQAISRPFRGRRGACGLLLSALVIGGLSLAPRGVEVTVHNMTSRVLTVRVEAGQDVALIRGIEPRQQGTAEICPRHDSSIELAFDFRGQAVATDLRVYTFSGAVGSASATIVADDDSDAPPSITDVSHDSGYSPWSLLPRGLFVRGAGVGLALGLLMAAWISLRATRSRGPEVRMDGGVSGE